MARRDLVTAKTERKIVAQARHSDPISGPFGHRTPQAPLPTRRSFGRVPYVRHVPDAGGLALYWLIAVCISSVFGFLRAQNFGNQHGRYPGNVPPIGWAAICLFPLAGSLTQYFVARNTLKKIPQRAPSYAGSWTPPPAPGLPQQGAPQYPSAAPLAAVPYAAPQPQFPANPYAGPPANTPAPAPQYAAPSAPPQYAAPAPQPQYAAAPAAPQYSAPQFAGRSFSAPDATTPSVPQPYATPPAPQQYAAPEPQPQYAPPPAQPQYPSSIPPAPPV